VAVTEAAMSIVVNDQVAQASGEKAHRPPELWQPK